jgi:hypothetical protein
LGRRDGGDDAVGYLGSFAFGLHCDEEVFVSIEIEEGLDHLMEDIEPFLNGDGFVIFSAIEGL